MLWFLETTYLDSLCPDFFQQMQIWYQQCPPGKEWGIATSASRIARNRTWESRCILDNFQAESGNCRSWKICTHYFEIPRWKPIIITSRRSLSWLNLVNWKIATFVYWFLRQVGHFQTQPISSICSISVRTHTFRYWEIKGAATRSSISLESVSLQDNSVLYLQIQKRNISYFKDRL